MPATAATRSCRDHPGKILMIVPGYFDKIFSCDCDLSNPKIADNKLIVCVGNIGVISGHLLYQRSAGGGPRMFRSGHLIFEDVEASVREIYEYKVNPTANQFKPKRIVEDGPFPRPKQATETFDSRVCWMHRQHGYSGL
jgi:hypothetical protein